MPLGGIITKPPKGIIGKNETVDFLVPNELKGGGTEISREISVPRRIFPPIRTAFSPDDFNPLFES